MKKSEIRAMIKEEMLRNEGRMFPKELERLDQESTFDDKMKLI